MRRTAILVAPVLGMLGCADRLAGEWTLVSLAGDATMTQTIEDGDRVFERTVASSLDVDAFRGGRFEARFQWVTTDAAPVGDTGDASDTGDAGGADAIDHTYDVLGERTSRRAYTLRIDGHTTDLECALDSSTGPLWCTDADTIPWQYKQL